MSFLTGSGPSQSNSNVNNGLISGTYLPQAQTGVQANNVFASLLGVPTSNASYGYTNTGQPMYSPGSPTANGAGGAAYNTFKNSSGYQNIFNEAMRGVTGSQAGRGLLDSGSTGRALQTTGGNLAQGSFGNYLAQLQALAGQGTQAGSLIGNVGQQSQSSGGSGGLLGVLGAALPFIAPGIGSIIGPALGAVGGGGGSGVIPSSPNDGFTYGY